MSVSMDRLWPESGRWMTSLARVIAIVASTVVALGYFAAEASLAQDSSQQSAAAGDSAFAGGQDGGMGGGAAMADFNTLMNLIQQTVDPDSWLLNGGTSTILPYPAGVYVDPKGHMKRVRPAEQITKDLFSERTGVVHPWRETSSLRTVSLKRLDQAIRMAMQTGLSPDAELLQLAGLSRIQYVKIDVDNEDILLAGPAGNSVLGFELQDLAVVAALISHHTQPLGCSIEPSDQGIRDAQQLLREPSMTRTLARNPKLVVGKMQDAIGSHRVKVFGMAANTGTAVALIDADEHMKRVGFGTEKLADPVDSYFDHMDRLGGKVPRQSLIRWWFAFADEPVKTNASGDIFQLPEQCVAVMSEQQWVTQQGRAPTGASDAAADAFASGMTDRLKELRKSHASYARLSAVFEFSLALQLATETTGLPSLKSWLPALCALGTREAGVAEELEATPTPKTVEGLTTWHKLKNGTVLAVVSGGVKIDTLEIASRKTWKESKFLASSVIPVQQKVPSVAHGNWWWDSEG
ncbi:MAG: DUF1598 domain-containing protein [Pirellulaceae bacterium]